MGLTLGSYTKGSLVDLTALVYFDKVSTHEMEESKAELTRGEPFRPQLLYRCELGY